MVGGRRYRKESGWSILQGMERLEGEGIGRKVVGGRRYWKEGAWSILQGMERLEGEGIGRKEKGEDCTV